MAIAPLSRHGVVRTEDYAQWYEITLHGPGFALHVPIEAIIALVIISLLVHRRLRCRRASALDDEARQRHHLNGSSSESGCGSEGAQVLERCREFELICRESMLSQNTRIVQGTEEAFCEAMNFVRVICEGVARFARGAEVVSGTAEDAAALRIRLRKPLRGDIATKSRIPYTIQLDAAGVEFRISRQPPKGQCPFRCACHARCFGPASGSTLPWGELKVQLANGVCRSYAAAPQAFRVNAKPEDLAGLRLVYVPENRIADVNLRDAAAVLAEKHKPQTQSDGALVRAAHEAGARCVIKIGGGGTMLYCVSDPVDIPCLAISEENGKELIEAFKSSAQMGASQEVLLTSYIESDRRANLEAERYRDEAMFWLHCEGISLRAIDWDEPLSSVVRLSTSHTNSLVYEDYSGLYMDRRESDIRLSPDRSKLRRMMESAWAPLCRAGLASNPAMLGKLLAVSSQRCHYKITYIKFFRARTQKGTACTMLLSDAGEAEDAHKVGSSMAPSSSVVQAWIAHEAVYLALMGYYTKLIEWVAASLWNFIKCTNGEFFGWEADSAKIIKLFTACTGPVGDRPKEAWMRNDPTWCIVDEKSLGIVTRTQGRVLWSEEGSAQAVANNSTDRSNLLSRQPALRRLAMCSARICG